MYHNRRQRNVKLQRGQQFEARVRDLASDGRGIVAHPEGRVFFVPGVWIDEQACFEITELKGRTGTARLVELVQATPERVAVDCVYHGFDKQHCGGCGWMFMGYEQQLTAKQNRVQQAVSKLFGGFEVAEILRSPRELGYRNRAQLKTDGHQLGYMAPGSHSLIDVQTCAVLNAHNQHTLSTLRSHLPSANWKTKSKQWISLHIDDDIQASDVQLNARRPFRQGNSEQNDVMRDWVRNKLSPTSPKSKILELFAGSGNFTEVLHAAGWSSVFAIDSFLPAVNTLRERSLSGVESICLNLDAPNITDQFGKEIASVEALLLDPPRQGMKYLYQILKFASRLKSVAYVSCDIATFARDCAALKDAGFAPVEVQPLDLFPQTPHVEVMSLFRKVD